VVRGAEVGAAFQIRFANGAADARRFGERLVSVGIRQGVLPDDDPGVDARLVDGAENLDDASGWRTRRRRPARQLDDHHLPRCGPARISRRDLHVGQHPAIERDHVADASVVRLVAANERAVTALEDPDDPPFRAIAALVLDPRDDTVSMEGFLDVRGRDVEILIAGAIRHDEAVAGRVHLQSPDDDVHAIGEAEAVAPDLEQFAFRDEGLQQPAKRRAVLARHS